ncbi:hypothetical protein IAT38_000507 [Cryptococcus sp. DSM 104549]
MPRSSTAITSTPYSRHAPRPLPAPHPPPLPSARPLDGLMATLPGEIHILILAYLLDADPVTLTRVSRSLWKQAIPQVYSDIVIEARNCQQLFYGLGSPFGQGIQDVRDLKDSVTALRDPPGFGPLSQKELGARLFDMLIMEIVPRTGLVRKLASFRDLKGITHLKKLVFIGRPPGKGLSDEEWTERVINRMWAMPDTSVWSWWLSLGGELRMMSRKASTWEAGRIEVSPASKTRSTTTRW